jgi:hypothetical protein
MKKLVIVLCLILSLCCVSAFAEQPAENTYDLWQHTFIEVDESGKQVEQTVAVTLTTKAPVDLSVVQNDVNDGYIAIVSRAGVAPVSIDIYPADVKIHANLSNATDEQAKILVDYMTEQYEEGTYTFDKFKDDDGNTFLALATPTIHSAMTVVENIELELIQAHFEEHFAELSEADADFAKEVLFGITMKETNMEVKDK